MLPPKAYIPNVENPDPTHGLSGIVAIPIPPVRTTPMKLLKWHWALPPVVLARPYRAAIASASGAPAIIQLTPPPVERLLCNGQKVVDYLPFDMARSNRVELL